MSAIQLLKAEAVRLKSEYVRAIAALKILLGDSFRSDQVRSGLSRAKLHGTKSGKPIGRPRVKLNRDQVQRLRDRGRSWREIATELQTSTGTVRRAIGIK